jgi:hypothetical protein
MAKGRIHVEARDVGRTTVSDEDFLILEGVRAVGEVYGPRKLVGLTSIGSRFERCSFQKLTVEDAAFGSGGTRSEYAECTFDGSSMRAPAVGWARFERCSFRDVRLTGWRSQADFVDCVFSGRAKNCVFNGTAEDPISGKHLRSVDFRGNDFSAMKFNEVEFWGGIDLRRQSLPTGPLDLYIEDPAAALDRARAVLRGWPDHDRREDALLSIDILLRDLESHNQEQLYVHIPDLGSDRVTQRALAEALTRPASSAEIERFHEQFGPFATDEG